MTRFSAAICLMLLCPALSASHPTVTDPIQRAYSLTPLKHVDSHVIRQHLVIGSGTLYTIKLSGERATLTTPPPKNTIVNGNLHKARFGVIAFMDAFQKWPHPVKTGELFYLDKITAAKDGLTFSFASFHLYNYSAGIDASYSVPLRMRICIVLTPAQLGALTPQSLHKLTDPVFDISPHTVDWLLENSE